jgi:MFS transporter, SHS family, lactate transporter
LCRSHASHFEKAKTAIEEGGGRDELAEDYQNQQSETGSTDRPGSVRIEDEKRSSESKV